MHSFDGYRRLLERRSPWGLVGAYCLAAWLVLQFSETLASLVGLPLWFGTAVIGLLAAGLVLVVLTSLLTGHSRLFSWKLAGIAGAAAVGLLAVGTAGWSGLRAMGLGPPATLLSRGVLAERAEIVLADFEDGVGDAGLVAALQQAFRVHLSQSPAITLAAAPDIGAALELMQRDRADGLDLDVAREVAVRQGWPAVLAGGIHAVGSTYTVTARLVDAESGEELAAAIQAARGPDELIPAIERLSVQIRERIGESLASLRRSPRLSQVRTSSLPALRSFTEGAQANSRGEFRRCVLLMEEAIARDSSFAMAYEGRAACQQNLGVNLAGQVADRIRAYEMRDRMTEEERLRFTAVYHQFVMKDRKEAVAAWEVFAGRYPRRTSAMFSLANLYAEGREWERAERTLLAAMERDPESAIVLINLAGYRTNLGRFAGADSAYRRLAAEAPGLELGWWRSTMHFAAADLDAAAAELAAAEERLRGDPVRWSDIALLQARAARIRGRIDEAERLIDRAAAAADEAGHAEAYLWLALEGAEVRLIDRADTTAALAAVEAALVRRPLDSLEALARPYHELAAFMARAGQPARARSYLAAWESEVAPLLPGKRTPHWVLAGLAEAEDRHADAEAEWRREDGDREDPLPALVGIARAHDAMGHADSAIVYYGRYLETPSRHRHASDGEHRARALARLAELHEARDDLREARRYYAEFAALWRDADAFLQPRVAAARARVSELDDARPSGGSCCAVDER